MIWKTIVGKIQEIAAMFSLSANSLLILLVLTKSPKQIGSYKYLIIYISVFEMCYSILDVILEPMTLSRESIFIVFVNIENAYFSRNTYLILISMWGAFFGSFMGLFALQFIYRYLVASSSRLIKTFQSYKLFLWMSIPVLCGLLWGFASYFFEHPDNQFDNAIRGVLQESFDWKVENVAYVGPYLYRSANDSSSKQIHVLNTIGFIVIFAISNSSIVLTLYCAIICFFTIKSHTNKMSKNIRNLHFQLYYALVTQTMIPVILMHLPVITLFSCTLFDMDLGNASSIVNVTIALFPALDPFPVMFIIKQYRKEIIKRLRSWTKSRTTINTQVQMITLRF
ncbi:unnamed protein product [Caenorhabditis angaria]|uniref:Serpentine receptor class r-10 n=1 Tax=Caenorhabditis angaria TaxID=860376 RepID=A0A9P1IWA5_9PELO|nr:unnamed protein product [Caenorhabditis angaria]